MKKSEFEHIIDKTFWGLESKHGFKRVEMAFHTGGVVVRFQNTTTEVALNYEISEVPWLSIADINDPENVRTSLDWLLVELGEKKSPTVNDALFPPKMEESQVEASIGAQCENLLKFGADMLNGDFSVMPRLQKRADDYLLECNKFAKRHKAKE